MKINNITLSDLRRMNGKEGLILQGCGGETQEWVDGINKMLTDSKTVKTNSKGEFELTDLVPGSYTVTEVTDSKYETQKSQTVKVESGKTATVTFENILKKGSLEVVKTSEDNLNKAVKFHLYGTSLSGAKDNYLWQS